MSLYYTYVLLLFIPYFIFIVPCIVINLLLNNQPDALIIKICSVIKLYIFRASSLPIIRSFLLYIRHWWVSRRFWRPLLSRDRMERSLSDGQKTCPKHVEFYSKNKFKKLVHLVGFFIRIYHEARSAECLTLKKCLKYLKNKASVLKPPTVKIWKAEGKMLRLEAAKKLNSSWEKFNTNKFCKIWSYKANKHTKTSWAISRVRVQLKVDFDPEYGCT
jgi:hypothetical protein